VNGSAIFGTRAWEKARINRNEEESIYFTQKGDDLFVILKQWPGKEFAVQGIAGTDKTNVSLLGYDGVVEWKTTEEGVIIRPPGVNLGTVPCDYAWVFKISDVPGLNSKNP
jgi:alpha-L-fucosidase